MLVLRPCTVIIQRKNYLEVQSWGVFLCSWQGFSFTKKKNLSHQRNMNHNSKHHDQQPSYYSVEFHSTTDLYGAYHGRPITPPEKFHQTVREFNWSRKLSLAWVRSPVFPTETKQILNSFKNFWINDFICLVTVVNTSTDIEINNYMCYVFHWCSKYGVILTDHFMEFSKGMLMEDFKNKTIILKTSITWSRNWVLITGFYYFVGTALNNSISNQ